MDPITIGASLLVALGAAVKEKATGAAAKYLQDAVEERARRLWGVLGESNEQKFARLMVEHVMEEAAQHLPDRALLVQPLGTVGIVGIWGPRGTLKLQLLWVNRADFPVEVRDVRVTGKVGGRQCEWDTIFGDVFTLRPRGDTQRIVELEPRLDLPTFERGGATCDLSVTALVCGPWEEGRAQQTQDLVPLVGIWLPVVGIEPSGVLTEVADIDLVLEHQLQKLTFGSRMQVRFGDFDRTHQLRDGATRERLAVVAGRVGCEVNAGPNLALVHRPQRATQFLRRKSRMEGW